MSQGIEKRKKRIALFLMGGNISLYQDSETGGVFSISSKKDIELHIPDLEKEVEVRLYANLPTKKSFLGMLDWKVLFEHIKDKADVFDGFVVAQETDSLLFASGLFSYLFSSFGKPIIFTSSATVLGEKTMKNLAKKNIEDALLFASTDLSEVAVCSHGKLIRAVRAKRSNIFSDVLFDSSQIDDIATIENQKPVLAIHRFTRENDKTKVPFSYPEKNIIFIKLFPDFAPEYFDDIIHRKHLDVLMIESLGYGSIKPNLLKRIEEISLSGIKVVILAKYDNNERRFFLDADAITSPYIIVLKNIPTWSAFAKVYFVAQNTNSALEFRKAMLQNICGEIL